MHGAKVDNSIGAMSSRTRSSRCKPEGFTILELLIMFAIFATISALAIPSLQSALGAARNARAVADIRTIGNEALGYQLQNGTSPLTLNDIGYGAVRDPWGAPYQYLNFSTTNGNGQKREDRFLVPINTYFDLYSMGPDGQSALPLTAQRSQDDIVWANDGAYIGLAANF